ncbi:Tfp pilus assembly protein FimT/FimU [Synechococcus sp. CS-1328]|uniref:pilus assembly FimT family protein n=1 Tax=Synechococcus sp. CS-1328 TaxID=2847976 RepID=UPI00223B0CCF|nr:type II secretion system protein [Synechococcus sp. CS-1328]MCT0224849.1 type II secretion system GspH family protein [Synechococcus sp. CS-1328]
MSAHLNSRSQRRRSRRPRGYSMAELLVTVAVLGILSAVVLNGIGVREWQRRKVNAVAVELNGWLESVRRSALKGTGCQVTIQTNASAVAGTVIASAAPVTTTTLPNTCMSEQPLRILANSGGDRYAIQADPATFSFTPRGTARGLPNGNHGDLEITISLNGQPPMRCVQLSSPLGLIRVGFSETTVSGSCTYPGLF